MDVAPDAGLERFLQEVLRADGTVEELAALYRVLLPALLDAYRQHDRETNPLVDHPTRRALRLPMAEKEEALVWGRAALEAVLRTDADRGRAEAWERHLRAYLAAAGGIRGDGPHPGGPHPGAPLPEPRASGPFVPDFVPRRDERFAHTRNFVFPPHTVCHDAAASTAEKVLALMCKRALEMDVPEAMSQMILNFKDQPWEFQRELARQLWDEARHAMIGEAYFEQAGIDWSAIPLHIGFSLSINQALTPVEGYAWLFTIEHDLMAAQTGKRYEWATAVGADDLAALYQDYDWADEVVHSQIGQRWLKRITGLSIQQIKELGGQAQAKSEQALRELGDPAQQVDWWPQFAHEVLGTAT
jgi:hypothetical protein